MDFKSVVAIFNTLAADVSAVGGTEADLLKIASHDGIRAKIVSLLVEEQVVKQIVNPVIATFQLSVNYGASVAQLVKMGKYKDPHPDINDKNFKTKRKGKKHLEAQLVHFGRDMSSEAVLAELDRLGLRPAELHELLAFGIEHPDEQLKHPIVALGSRWRVSGGGRPVVCLRDAVGYRNAYLDGRRYGCDRSCRFLAFRKESSGN